MYLLEENYIKSLFESAQINKSLNSGEYAPWKITERIIEDGNNLGLRCAKLCVYFLVGS